VEQTDENVPKSANIREYLSAPQTRHNERKGDGSVGSMKINGMGKGGNGNDGNYSLRQLRTLKTSVWV